MTDGCQHETREWSGIYGTSPRRVYWSCVACGTYGAILFPKSTDERHGEFRYRKADSVFEAVLQETRGIGPFPFIVETAERCLGNRNKVVPVSGAIFERDLIETAVHIMRQELKDAAEAAERKRNEQHYAELARMERLRSEVRRRRRAAPKPSPRPLKKLKHTKFPVLFHGGEATEVRGIIYGLIDPAEAERVRYVGQTTNAFGRFASHCSLPSPNRLARPDAREIWVRELYEQGRRPCMVLLERVRAGADLNSRERYWIRALLAEGQADLNTALPRECRRSKKETA